MTKRKIPEYRKRQLAVKHLVKHLTREHGMGRVHTLEVEVTVKRDREIIDVVYIDDGQRAFAYVVKLEREKTSIDGPTTKAVINACLHDVQTSNGGTPLNFEVVGGAVAMAANISHSDADFTVHAKNLLRVKTPGKSNKNVRHVSNIDMSKEIEDRRGVPTCSKCHMELPLSGKCDCDEYE